MESRELKDTVYGQLASMGRGLSHARRLELLDLLAQSPRTVDELATGTDRSVASTSQHLQVLARAGLVDRQRSGSHVVYTLAPGVPQLLVLLRRLGQDRLAGVEQARRSYAAAHPDVDSATLVEVQAGLHSGSILLLDVRPQREYRHGHIVGAQPLPLEQLDHALDQLPRDRELIACCRGPWCTFAVEAVERLRAAGFRARRFEAGVEDWRLAGGAVDQGAA